MARCPNCNGITPIGSNCLVGNTNCISVAGDGDEGSEFILSPVLSADPDQLLSCESDGLYGPLPALLTDPPTVQAYASAPQSIPSTTLTALTFNVERWDNDGMHSVSVNTQRITFTQSGKYMVTFVGAWQPQSGSTGVESYRIVTMRKNGTATIARDARGTVNDGFGVYVGQNLIAEEEFSATDYVEILVRHNAGVAIQYAAESYSPVFSAYRWGAS